ncbi:murein biosynthesis integral membrane protein MurJ [Mucisphaera calidilacus]|uniref:Probable lipid II flippase MurJ n=1 Tax=Mucisphaera calidilacus TaxID=2527982 RepID=A0A518C0G5_9BACT|nr:murein biosynthesis integral membrane protein MurJ [Mucisphaera calidilacus]QDU72715.1 Lipid II flippase MurJ [Mucisphaera calidilacus]
MTEPDDKASECRADDGGGVGRATVVVSGLTLVSRFTGLVRDAVLAATLGLSVWADIFFLAFLVPNLFRRLFGEGALTSAFIPAYTRLYGLDARRAAGFAGSVLAWTAGVTAVIAAVGVVALLIAGSWVAASSRASEALRLAAWMLPYMPLVCLVAMLGGLLQARGVFAPAAAAPILLNAAMISAALLAGALSFGASGVAFALALSVLVAGVLQLLWMVVASSRRGLVARPSAASGPEVGSMAWRMLPMAGGLAVFQVNALLDHVIAFVLSPPDAGVTTVGWLPGGVAYPIETGSVAALQWSQRLYQFPLGVFGIAVATAAFPALARAASDPRAFGGVLRRGLGLSLWLTLPASVGLALVAEPLVALIYERGAFDGAATARVALLLLAYGSAVWAYSLTHVLTRACYALDRPTWPLRVMAATVPLNLVLNLTLIWPLGAVGLAWSTAAAAVVQALGLALVLRRRGGLGMAGTATRVVVASVVMGVVVWLLDQRLAEASALVRVAGAVGVGMAVYALASWPLGLMRLLASQRTG